jgi:adenosylhomocysteine nucleosidase
LGQIPNQPKYFINKHPSLDHLNLATGMTFINSLEQLKKIKSQISVDIFDMEAAAIAQICNKNNIDFIVVKSISDVIAKTNDNLVNINECIKLAANNSFRKLTNLIEKIA